MKSCGTIPYLGIFLNDLAMLHESAPDWLPKPSSPQPCINGASRGLCRPASGSCLASMTSNIAIATQDQERLTGFPKKPPRRTCGNVNLVEMGCGGPHIEAKRPPLPAIADRRVRRAPVCKVSY